MMHCFECAAAMPDNMIYCLNCGAKLGGESAKAVPKIVIMPPVPSRTEIAVSYLTENRSLAIGLGIFAALLIAALAKVAFW